jgi:TM2 domain-containing membrane protein YozV
VRYVLAFFFPWLSFFTIGKIGRGFLCLLLQLTIIGWLPAVIWAVVSVGGYNADKRTDRLVNAITQSARAVPATPDPRRI